MYSHPGGDVNYVRILGCIDQRAISHVMSNCNCSIIRNRSEKGYNVAKSAD